MALRLLVLPEKEAAMDDHQRPEDIPPRADRPATVADERGAYAGGKPKRLASDTADDSGPDATEAPEEEGSASG